MESEEFESVQFEKKLTNLKDTQESIQSMSTWCLQNRNFHKKIVASWLNVLKQVKIDHRLTLFHLANDVIQYSKRKNYEFVESWGTTLQRATTMVRDEKVKHKILRIFKIWEQRGVYNDEFLSDLNGLLNTTTAKKTHQQKEVVGESEEPQTTALINNMRDCVKLQEKTDKSFKILTKSSQCDIDNIKHSLKDRSHVEDVEKEIDDSLGKLESYVNTLKAEIKARGILLTALEQAEAFYHNQRGEVKVVANAYRNFGNRIKSMKKKLDELTPTLPSPMPSPDINAPSPEPDNDFELPGEGSLNLMDQNYSNGFMSYMDGALPFDINDFRQDSPISSSLGKDGHAQPIQVINSRGSEKDDNSLNINDFFKSILSDSYGTQAPQPVPPVAPYVSNISNYGPSSQNSYDMGPDHNNYSGNNSSFSDGYQGPVTNYPSGGQPMNNYKNSGPTIMPLLPPPMPPAVLNRSDTYTNAPWDMGWDSSRNSSGFNQTIETPSSPPHFERKGAETNILEYIDNETEELVSAATDVDHRQLNIPEMPGIHSNLDKTRALDVDHRNLISLTGSPGPKGGDGDVPPPPLAPPPMIWPSVDTDYRSNMHGASGMPGANNADSRSIESSYREKSALLPPPPPPSIPLEPPPLHKMDAYLRNQSNEYEGNKRTIFSQPPPGFAMHSKRSRNETSPIKGHTKSPTSMKNQNGPDNVESVDMEMSDEDIEDYSMGSQSTPERMEISPPKPLATIHPSRLPFPMNFSTPQQKLWGVEKIHNPIDISGVGNTNNDWDPLRPPANLQQQQQILQQQRGNGGGPIYPSQNRQFASPLMTNNYRNNIPMRGAIGGRGFRSRGRPHSFRGNKFRGNMRGGNMW